MQEMKTGQEVRSPALLLASGVIMVTTLWASTFFSEMGFSGKQSSHLSCPQNRAEGHEEESIEQMMSRFFPPLKFSELS